MSALTLEITANSPELLMSAAYTPLSEIDDIASGLVSGMEQPEQKSTKREQKGKKTVLFI
jgi:hypothetical protein